VVYVRSHRALPEGLLIIWQWVESTGVSEYDRRSVVDDNESADELSTIYAGSDDEHTECTVPFKCIGVTRESSYQNLLKELKGRLEQGDTVEIKLVPDDSQAITFQSYHNGSWQTMGYVVREVLSEVHNKMANNNIVGVKISWIKYKLWKKSPGFYSAIDVTCKGEWSRLVWQARSTFS